MQQETTYQIGPRTYSINVLQQLSDKAGFTKHNTEIESARCEADLMYTIFKRPETVTDVLLEGLIALIKKKDSPDLEKSRIFTDAVAFLCQHPRASQKIKIFNILLILSREPEAVGIIRDGYVINHPGNMWGDRAFAHLDSFLQEIAKMIHGLYTSNFGEPNIITNIHTAVLYAEKVYLTKE
jgi:hypothetical protein